MSLRRIGVVIFVLLAFGVLIFTIGFKGQPGESVCSEMLVEIDDEKGFSFITQKDVVNILNANGLNPISKPTADVKLDKIRAMIEKNPYVRQAKCYLTKSNKLNIEVSQREPVFRVINSESYFVDNERVMVECPNAISAYLPVVGGVVAKSFAQNELYDFVTYIEADNFLSNLVQQIYVVGNNNIELTPTAGNQTIILGRIDKNSDYKTRLERLKAFYLSEALNSLGWDTYSSIDLRYDKQIVCKKR